MRTVKEQKLHLKGFQIDTIRFGTGVKPLVMIQGLNTNGIKGSGIFLAWMYRMFARDYTVYLFDRRPEIPEGMTVREMAGDVAEAMDALTSFLYLGKKGDKYVLFQTRNPGNPANGRLLPVRALQLGAEPKP